MKNPVSMSKGETTFPCRRLALGVAISGLLLGGQPTFAQDSDIEEIQVTGSFLSRPADRPQPVSVIDNTEIEANQRVTLAEVVRDLPQITTANVTANSLNPTNSINLRGLGDRSTLILLNGQRQTVDANGQGAVDINNLAPAIMIERLELVLDGASALYGSDAVAGVANFITRNSYEGLEIQASSQVAEAQSSVPEVSLSGIFGVQGPRTGVVMAVEWQNRADVMEASDIRSDERLEEGLKTAFFNPGSFQGVNGSFYPDPLCGSTEIGGTGEARYANPAGFVDGPFCRGLLTHQRTLIPESESLTGMAVLTHDFDMGWLSSFRGEMNFAKSTMRRHEGTGLPFLAQSSYDLLMPASNPGVIDANQRNPDFPVQDYQQIFSRMQSPVEGPVVMRTKQWTQRVAATLEGRINAGWDWQVQGTFSQNDQFSQDVDVIMDRFVSAVAGYGGPNCKWNPVQGVPDDLEPGVGNCMYWNPFASRLIAEPGDPTYNDPILSEWIQWGESPVGAAQFYSLEGIVTGDLWDMAGGTTGLALGAQFRRQVVDIDQDPVMKDGGFGFAPQVVLDWDSQRDTEAVFAEMAMYPTNTLEFGIAARYEDTEGKSSVEPKVSMLWTPRDDLFLRASAGSSFRLASEYQSFGVGEGGGSVYPIGGEVTQARGLTVGNPDLEPEESENWTIGATWDATPNLTLEATWWDYDFSNLIVSTDATDILLADIADGFIDNLEAHPVFPGRPLEVCEITGRWQGPDSGQPLPEGCTTGLDFQIFNNSWINQDTVTTSGLDFNIDWSSELLGGEFGARLAGTYVHSYKGNNAVGELQEVAGTDGFGVSGVSANPDLRMNLVNTWRNSVHSVRSTVRYTAGTENTNPDPNVANTSEDSYTQWDLSYTFYITPERSVTFSALNVTDEEPPLVANGLLTSNAGLYDPRGRMWRLALNYGF